MNALGLPAHVALMFAVPLILIVGMIAAIIVRHAVTAAKNSASPVVTEKVTVVAKRQMISGGPGTGHHTAYFVTFESGGGERKELSVKGGEYGLTVEGDSGYLTSQGTRFISFERIR